jgi:hypothetical protein
MISTAVKIKLYAENSAASGGNFIKLVIDIALHTISRFRIQDSGVYRLGDISPQRLFNRANEPRLNGISCTGKYVPCLEKHEKRLIVETVLMDE